MYSVYYELKIVNSSFTDAVPLAVYVFLPAAGAPQKGVLG